MYIVTQTEAVGQHFLQMAAKRWNKWLLLMVPFSHKSDCAGEDGNAVIYGSLATEAGCC